ncbi:MAG: SDR family oxidoreductase [Candidatus Brocadiia bacterium]|nr:SDR family oxidoreductase [Candidatus Brocadiia bacterium]
MADLIRVSNEVGRDRNLVQGGGGNTSVKTAEGTMYVKASGTALAEMSEGHGYRLVDVEQCLAILHDDGLAAMESAERDAEVVRRLVESCRDENEGRPSVETTLHALLGPCVVHTHPSVIGGLLCANGGRAALEEILADADPPPLYVEYCDPGYPLAARMGQALAEYRERTGRLPEIVFLENHGLFVSAGDADTALELTHSTFAAVEGAWRARSREVHERRAPAFPRQEEAVLIGGLCSSLRRTYSELLGRPVLVRFGLGDPVKLLLSRPDVKELTSAGPLVPDQVVYCLGAALWVRMPEDPAELRSRVEEAVSGIAAGPATPTCLLVDGLGLFAVGTSPKLLESALCTMEAGLQMLVVAAAFGGPRALPKEAAERMGSLEAEHYRRSLFAGQDAQDPLSGRVAVVSGAGSGLGRGISIGLAKRGVHVVLADIDMPAAQETASRIAEDGGAGTGLPAKADVTSESSVRDLFEYTTAHLGGVDTLVNCAGLGPLYPLADFPVDVWRKVLEVNLTGYFLMGREAAKVMARQGTGGSIVNISSKTGLEPSKNHSAYNATKAAEIHLARGWALELAEDGIRVNTVCPGNVFKESKIWNEDYINALAQKRGIRPEEVIPHYIDMTALEQDVEWDDIADAVAFLTSPAASKITGQTLVVDAGQVFVR